MKAPLRRVLISLSIANGLLLFGYGLSLPFFTIYLIGQKGMSASMAGLVIGLCALSRSVCSALAGELSDVFGRKPLMLWGLALEVVAMLAMIVCMQFQADIGWLLLSYFLTTFFGAAFRPVSNAWISDHARSRQRVEAFGIIRIGINLGWAFGPAVGGFLVRYSYSYAFCFTAFAYALTVLYLKWGIPDDKHVPGTNRQRRPQFVSMVTSLKDSRLAKICFYVLLITAVNSQFVVGLSVHCTSYLGMPEHYIGWFFTINGITTILLQYHAAKWMTGRRLSTAMLIGCCLYALGFGSIGFFASFALLSIGVFLSTVGELIVNPAEQTMTSNIAAPSIRGRYLGMLMVFYNVGSAIGFFGAGWLSQYIAPIYLPGPWLIVGTVAVLAGLGFWNMRRVLTNEQDGKFTAPVAPNKEAVALQ